MEIMEDRMNDFQKTCILFIKVNDCLSLNEKALILKMCTLF